MPAIFDFSAYPAENFSTESRIFNNSRIFLVCVEWTIPRWSISTDARHMDPNLDIVWVVWLSRQKSQKD